MTPDDSKIAEGKENRPQREGGKLGPGTATKGRLAGGGPPEDLEVVGNKKPPYDVTGVDAISPLLEYVSFPASRDMIVERIGHVKVPVSKMQARPVRDVLEKVVPRSFDSSAEVEEAVKDVWDQIAPEEGRGRGSQHFQNDDTTDRPRID